MAGLPSGRVAQRVEPKIIRPQQSKVLEVRGTHEYRTNDEYRTKGVNKGPIDLCWRAGAAQEIKEPTQPPLSSSVSQAQEKD